MQDFRYLYLFLLPAQKSPAYHLKTVDWYPNSGLAEYLFSDEWKHITGEQWPRQIRSYMQEPSG